MCWHDLPHYSVLAQIVQDLRRRLRLVIDPIASALTKTPFSPYIYTNIHFAYLCALPYVKTYSWWSYAQVRRMKTITEKTSVLIRTNFWGLMEPQHKNLSSVKFSPLRKSIEIKQNPASKINKFVDRLAGKEQIYKLKIFYFCN